MPDTFSPSPPINEASAYGVTVDPAQAQDGQYVWRATQIHHLTADENRGRHNIFFNAFYENGNEARDIEIWWEWAGQHPDQPAPPVKLDKAAGDPCDCFGDLPIDAGQVITCWVEHGSDASDKIAGLSTEHGTEFSGDGQAYNSFGHHSFAVTFRRGLETVGPGPRPPVGSRPESARKVITLALSEPSSIKVAANGFAFDLAVESAPERQPPGG